MSFLRRLTDRGQKGGEHGFEPDDFERSFVDPLIDNREEFSFKVLSDKIMESGDIDDKRKPLLIDWARSERGTRPRSGQERLSF